MQDNTHASGSIALAVQLRDLLSEVNLRLVLAESCTAGRVSATLSSLPGISQWLCGSLVVYRCDSKTRWLGIPADLLTDRHVGAVSREVSRMLAIRALTVTPEAHLAVAVTGDVGPGAAVETDGRIFCAGQFRDSGLRELSCVLQSPAPTSDRDVDGRIGRLEEATDRVLRFTIEAIQNLQATRAAGPQ